MDNLELLELFVKATDLAVNDPDGFREVTGQVLTALGKQETYQAAWNGIVADITSSRGMGHMAGDAVVTMTVAGMLRKVMGEGTRLAKSIEFLDESLLRKYWKREIEFDGVKVYQRDDLFDPMYFDEKSGMTNLELMKNKKAPIGVDGKKVNLHHSIQADEGPIVEVLSSMHEQYRELIHVNVPHTDFRSGIDRGKFNRWREGYWKARAQQIEKGLE